MSDGDLGSFGATSTYLETTTTGRFEICRSRLNDDAMDLEFASAAINCEIGSHRSA
jgi:hypothetical protein